MAAEAAGPSRCGTFRLWAFGLAARVVDVMDPRPGLPEDRAIELGTLRAAGVAPGMLARLVAAENLALVAIGIPVGILTGTLLARWLVATHQAQGYHWSLQMRTLTPVYVALAVLAAALLAQAPVLRTLRRIDIARIVRERSL